MRRERAAGINSGSHYTVLFFSAYFIYYAAYCIFSSYTVLFLTERAYSATVCGIITSLTFLANLLMEPVGGYITDTFLPTRRYLLLLIGMISAIGVRNVVENKVDFTKSRNLIVAAVILVSGLGFGDGITFTVAGTSITLTSLAIAAILGIALNAILPGKDYEFDE